MPRLRLASSIWLWLLPEYSHASSINHNESLHQILRNVRQFVWTDPSSGENSTFAVALPCSYFDEDSSVIPFIQESTAALVAAKALAKTYLPSMHRDTLSSLDDLAWDLMDAILFPKIDQPDTDDYFQSQGLLPKYWYFLHNNQQEASNYYYYLPNTRFPHWSLFQSTQPISDSPLLKSSQRLSALPLHASILWDMLLAVIPPQPDPNTDLEGSYNYNYDQNKDWWDRVEDYYEKIYQYHTYLHEVVMRGCATTTDEIPAVPCYNILHPWESLMDSTSPVWEVALQSTMDTMEKEKWKLPFTIPPLVRESYDFPSEEVYNAMMYLFLEGWNQVNFTQACPSGDDPTCPEDALLNQTQFAVLDVGYAAILSQADADLEQLGRVLRQVLPDSNFRRDQQLDQLENWQRDNARILEEVLWHPAYYTYMSQYYSPTTGKMEWFQGAVSNNLMPFWNYEAAMEADDQSNSNNPAAKTTVTEDDVRRKALAQEHIQDLSLQLLRREGKYSFDCGLFPIWSQGGCQRSDDSTIIQPMVNYLIASGLLRSVPFGTFGRYLSDQSVELLSRDFGEAYRAKSPYDNLSTLDSCGISSTLTAAIVYNFLVPDPARTNRLPLPPIRRSWVITLITFELLVAFSIGVSCLVLSFNLVRRLRDYTPVPLQDEDYDDYDSYNEDTEENGDLPTQQHYDSTGNTDLPTPTATAEGRSFFSSIGLN